MSRVTRQRPVAGRLSAVGGSVIFVAVVIYFINIDLDEADKRGSVFGALIGLAALAVSIWASSKVVAHLSRQLRLHS